MKNASRKKNKRIVSILATACLTVILFQNCSQFNSAAAGGSSSLASAIAGSTPSPGVTITPTPTPGLVALPNGAQLLWADEFNDSAVSWNDGVTGGTWVSTSGGGNGNIGWGSEFNLNPVNSFGLNPFIEGGGGLTIRADLASAAVSAQTGSPYVSGGMRTAKLDFGNGYYEMSAKMPSGSGMWPAFWLLPADFSWPPEIDIVEYLGNSPTVDFTTVHSTVQFPNANNWGHWQLGAGNDTGVDLSAGYHTYGVDFEPATISFYFDHVLKFTVTTPSDLVNRKMYMILNLAINGWGNSGNVVDANTHFPADYKVDYVRYYSAVPF